MRRFSQRNSLVTLSDINITPLLDLAFVLLIIFVITTPLLEQSLDLSLPGGGRPDRRELEKEDIQTVEITPRGEVRLGGKAMSAAQLERELVKSHRLNPKTVVYIRADRKTQWDHVAKVLDLCSRNGISQVSPRTAPTERP
jgi:biopolymer transport protein ExbD